MTFAVFGLLVLAAILWGLQLIYAGVRGVPSLSAPACGKCGYDLRGFTGEPPTTCSECGADLARPGAVRLARLRREPARALRGVAVIAAAVIGLLVLRWVETRRSVAAYPAGSPFAIATQTNAQVIAGLSTTANTPWGWQELERRLTAGTLPQADVTAAVEQYIAYRSTAGPNARAGPLSWCENFMKQAHAAGLITPPQFDRLADAYFGPRPVVTIAAQVSPGRAPVKVEYGGPWDLLGWSTVYAVRSVTLEDGRAVSVLPAGYVSRDAKADANRLSGTGTFGGIDATVGIDAVPGPHTLTFAVDAGLIDQDTRQLISNGSNPGQADQWPSNVVRRARVVKVPVTVLAAGAAAVERVTDTAHAGWPPFTLKSVTALPGDGGTTVRVDLVGAAATDVDCAYDVSVTVDGHRQALGVEDRKGSVGSSSEHRVVIHPAIPGTAMTATVTLTPNPDRAAKTAGVTRVWDVPIEFKYVPLRRLDVRQ